MKKSLLAVAAMGAFASAAQAQSSVTVYGILDVGFQGVTTRGGQVTGTNPAYQNPSLNGKTNQTRFSGEGAQSTSRLGFRGNEDLGGGRAAFFTVEFGLNPTDATLSGNTGNGLFNRQSFVGLSQKGVGRAAIGTQNTPVHMAVVRTDPGQVNNMLGNVIYATNASQGSGQTTASYTVRYNNALTLTSERIAGFQINAIYNNNNQNSNQTNASTWGGSTNNNAYGGGINFVHKKLNVDFAIQGSQSTNWAAQNTTGPAGPATPNLTLANPPANPLGAVVIMNQMYGGAVYDFGILKAYAQYVSNKISSQVNTGQYIERTAQQIGVRGNWTPKIESWASAGTGRITGQNIGQSAQYTDATASMTQNFTGYQLGTNYILSKRTNLYGIFGSTQVSSSSVAASEGGSSYGVGIRHTF
jgi:predicted porin